MPRLKDQPFSVIANIRLIPYSLFNSNLYRMLKERVLKMDTEVIFQVIYQPPPICGLRDS